MRNCSRLRDALGAAALAVVLLLISPGVRVVHADEAPGELVSRDPALEAAASRPPVTAGPSCSVGEPVHAPSIEALMARIRAQIAADAGAAGGEPDVTALNNRGFNYDRTESRPADPRLLQVESTLER